MSTRRTDERLHSDCTLMKTTIDPHRPEVKCLSVGHHKRPRPRDITTLHTSSFIEHGLPACLFIQPASNLLPSSFYGRSGRCCSRSTFFSTSLTRPDGVFATSPFSHRLDRRDVRPVTQCQQQQGSNDGGGRKGSRGGGGEEGGGGLSPIHLFRLAMVGTKKWLGQIRVFVLRHLLRQNMTSNTSQSSSPPSSRTSRKTKKSSSSPWRTDDPGGEWVQLVEEFEERANARYGTSTGRRDVASAAETIIRRNKLIVNSPRQPYLNPGQFKYLRHAESGSMAAVTIVLWYLGKIFRLDAFLLLFYPLPTLYIAARWGLSDADSTLCVILLLSFLLQGPFFTKSYFFNTGLLTLTYSRMLWHRRSWYVSLLCGALAKAVGVVLSLFWYALILRENTWTLITEQITQLLNGTIAKIVQLKVKLFADATAASLPAPVVHIAYVRIGVVAFIAVYSLYHVFCTYIFASLILIKVAERAPLARVPKDLPLLKRILRLDRVKRFDEL